MSRSEEKSHHKKPWISAAILRSNGIFFITIQQQRTKYQEFRCGGKEGVSIYYSALEVIQNFSHFPRSEIPSPDHKSLI